MPTLETPTGLPYCRQCHGMNTRTAQLDINHRIIRPTNGRAPYYMSICRDCERANNRARRARTSVPTITASALGIGRKYGVEIECYLPGGCYGTAAVAVKGALPLGWKMKTDASLGGDGVEVVSPPIKGQAGLDALQGVLTLLIDNGATVNRRCGLHVHHDVSDVGRNGMVLFARSWAANQDLIDMLVSPSRRSSARHRYCLPLSTSELRNLDTTLPERYRTVNLRAYALHGTIEIRQHQGTLSFRKIEGWIKLTQGLLDSVSGRNTHLPSSGNLQSLFRAATLDEDTSAYFLGRAMQFGAPASTLGLTAVAA